MVKVVLAVFFGLVFLFWGGARVVSSISFDRNCGGYIKRAADANTVELAKENLSVALEYLQRTDNTSGYTSILWTTPDEDVSFWYGNLSASLEELKLVQPQATQLEKSNLLMKLRETLLDHGAEGATSVTCPEGISISPHNKSYCFWGLMSGLLCCIFLIVTAVEYS